LEDSGRVNDEENLDYRLRKYLSATEAARLLQVTVQDLHRMVRESEVPVLISTSGQQRFDLSDLRRFIDEPGQDDVRTESTTALSVEATIQTVHRKSAVRMKEMEDESVHLMVTSPPYFNTKMYSRHPIDGDLGDIHSIEGWFQEIGNVWREVHRVLQPGRRAFINIMNLPIRLEGGGFRTLNLVGKTVDLCESMGFTFKRDIVWQKTNGVRAPFGTYPYPGGILLNNMHEFILEFEKACPRSRKASKYAHLTRAQKEASKLDKDFWLGIKNSDVWLMAPQGSGDQRHHVAPFPLELPSRLIRAFSFRSETVLDPFLGSGTTLMAAARLGRNGVGYEINPEIADEAIGSLKHCSEKCE
jgi:modification methylase